MDAERETQFLAALLELGSIPGIAEWIRFDSTGEPVAWRRQTHRSEFYDHKNQLLRWLAWNNIVNVYIRVPDVEAPAVIETLSSECAVWVGEFYQWLLEQQHER